MVYDFGICVLNLKVNVLQSAPSRGLLSLIVSLGVLRLAESPNVAVSRASYPFSGLWW